VLSALLQRLEEVELAVTAPSSCAEAAVARVCTAGEGSGSDLGAGGSGNEAGGGEIEYDGRVAGIDASVGEVGRYGAQRADRGWWEAGVLM
jgi:hypothetical protein